MRTTTALMIAASMLAAPAYAQDYSAGDTAAADAGTLANTDASLAAEAPANGLTTDPGAAPIVTDNAMVDTTFGEPADDDDDDGRFPWGLLGLLGLAGLLGRRRSDTDREGRTTR